MTDTICTTQILVHYDTCDLSDPLLHGVKLAPERSEMGHSSHKDRILFYSTFT